MSQNFRSAVRLLCAWVVAAIGGALGMLIWAGTLQKVDLGSIGYALGAIAFSGLGVFVGALIGRKFLTSSDREKFLRAPPDEN